MAKSELLESLGTTGLRRSGGWILEEFLDRLGRGGQEAIRFYREMLDNSVEVGTMMFLTENFIKQTRWWFEPADEKDPQAVEQAEFMETVIEDMSHSWDEFMSELLSFLGFGWAYHEIVYKIRKGKKKDARFRSQHDDGKWGWRKIPIRSQDSFWKWEFEDDGGLRGMWQNDFYATGGQQKGLVFIPIEKSLLFRTKSRKNNPEGKSLLRNAVISYYYLKRMREIEAIGVERDLAGYPIAFVPLEVMSKQASDNQKAMRRLAQDTVRQIRRDEREGAVWPTPLDQEGKPTGWDLKLLATGGRRQFPTNDIIMRYSTDIRQTLLTEFTVLGTPGVGGSRALAGSKAKTFARALGSIMDDIASVVNRFAVPPLMDLNAVKQEHRPFLVHGEVEAPPLDEVGSFIKDMADTGIPVDDDATQRKLREFANLPELEAESKPR